MRRLLALLALLVLAACGEVPAETQVRDDLAQRLDSALGQGAVRIDSLRVQGSAPSAAAPGEAVVVHFRVDLGVLQPLGQGGWDAPGAVGLRSVLGAGPRGVAGLKAEGNGPGDRIAAFGTSVWRRDGQAWVPLEGSAPSGEAPRTLGNQAPATRSERLLAALDAAVQAAPRGTTPSGIGIVEQELAFALASIESRFARVRAGYAVATGPEGGEYARLGAALQATGRSEGPRFVALPSAGSVENLQLLLSQRVTLALVQADTAAAARAGIAPFDEATDARGLRALGALFPEHLHVVVRGESGIARIEGLAGRRVVLGPFGSGSRMVAERVLREHGVEAGALGAALELGFAAGLAALEAGQADAMLVMIAAPAAELRTAFLRSELRLLPLDEGAIGRLAAEPGLVAAAIPAGVYRGQAGAVPAIATPALLLADTRLTDPEAEELVRHLFQSRDAMVREGSTQAARIGATTARQGLTVPLHEGARRALEAMR